MASPASSSSPSHDYCSDALDIVRNNYDKLTYIPIDPMLSLLFAKEVITLQEIKMIQSIPLSRRKMEYLLDAIIIPSLQSNIIVKFQAFLDVMEQSEYAVLKHMAKRLIVQGKAHNIEESSVNTTDPLEEANQIEESSLSTAADQFNCSNAKKIIVKNYDDLTHLPIDLMLSMLFTKSVITIKEKKIIQALPLRCDKMQYLLNNVIIPNLDENIALKFKGFLETMEESDDLLLIHMAKKLDPQQKTDQIEESSVSTTVDQIDCSYAKEIILKNYGELLTHLFTDNGLLIDLYDKGIIALTEYEIMKCLTTSHETTQYFLNSIIIPSLDINFAMKFKVLLQAMKNSIDRRLKDLGKQLEIEILDRIKFQILQSLSKARKDGCLIKVRYGKILICGASEAGKTNFLNLLMEDEFQPVHISAEAAKPQRVAMKAQISKNDEVIFIKMKIDDEIDLLKSYLPKKHTKLSHSIQDDISEIQKKCTITEDMMSKLLVEEINVKIGTNAEGETDLGKEINLGGETNSVEEALATRPPWDILTFMDTGGQPQFISMLPAVNSFAMITFIVHKLKESLDASVEIKHGDAGGKDSCLPYKCEYKYHQLVETLMLYASSILYPDKEFLRDYKNNAIKAHNKDKSSSSISLIGTYSTDVDENHIKEIDKILEKKVHDANIDSVKTSLNANYKFLVPIDSKAQEKGKINADTSNKKYTDPSHIRQCIYERLCEQDTYYVPIQWLLLELEIRKICIDRDCKFITYGEVLKLGKDKDLGEEDFIRDGLRFHHLFGVLLYFEEVKEMRELIIVDHQWLFDKLNAIVFCSFKNYERPSDHIDCKRSGVFKETMLDELDVSKDFKKSKIDTETIDPKKSLLNLLQYLRIIAPLSKEPFAQYFMPILLSSCNLTDVQQKIPGSNKFVTDTDEIIDSEPLLIQFRLPDNSYSFPRGIFCFLIVELMHSKKWEVYEQAHDNLLSFKAKKLDCYVTLIDRISCLEVQVTHNNTGPCGEIFITVRDAIVDAFDKIRNRSNINYELNFGLWYKPCGEKHIALIEGFLSCYCINDFKKKTTMQRSHMIWFVKTFKNLCYKQKDHLNVGGDRASAASSAIQEPDLKFIKDFIKSIKSRFRIENLPSTETKYYINDNVVAQPSTETKSHIDDNVVGQPSTETKSYIDDNFVGQTSTETKFYINDNEVVQPSTETKSCSNEYVDTSIKKYQGFFYGVIISFAPIIIPLTLKALGYSIF